MLTEDELITSQEENAKLMAMLQKAKARNFERRSQRSESSSVVSENFLTNSSRTPRTGGSTTSPAARLTTANLERIHRKDDEELRGEISRLKERLRKAQAQPSVSAEPLLPSQPQRQSRNVDAFSDSRPQRQSRNIETGSSHGSVSAPTNQGSIGVSVLQAELRKMREEMRARDKKIEDLEGRHHCQCTCSLQ